MPTGDGPEKEAADFLRGEPSAVGALCDAARGAIRAFQFADRALNEDLLQEALTRIFLGLQAGRFRGEASLRTYAGRVARYTCLEHLRRRRREVELDADRAASPDRWSRPEETLLDAEEHLANLASFARLPPECRELLRMVFVDGLSYREIGLKLGISAGAIKTRVHRCRAACRRPAAPGRPLRFPAAKRSAGRVE